MFIALCDTHHCIRLKLIVKFQKKLPGKRKMSEDGRTWLKSYPYHWF